MSRTPDEEKGLLSASATFAATADEASADDGDAGGELSSQTSYGAANGGKVGGSTVPLHPIGAAHDYAGGWSMANFWERSLLFMLDVLIWLGLANPTQQGDEKGMVGPPPEDAPLSRKETKYKLFALLCSCLLSVGSHYASNMLSALKCTLKQELEISNTQYSLLQAAVSLVNTIVPLFGGQFIDVFGTGWGSIVASTLIMVGDMIVAFSTEISSYPTMVIGRLIYGIGAGTIVTVQEAILAHWFHGRGLAIAVGLQISMSRLSSFLATGTVNEIKNATGFYGNAFWVSSAICAFSWLVNLAYVMLLRKVGEPDTMEKIRQKLRQKSMFSVAVLMRFPLSFWIVFALALFFGASWGPFTHVSTELVMERFGSDEASAAWQASVALAVPVVGSPLIGFFCDRYGKRPLIAFFSAFLLIISFALLGFTYASPLFGLSIFSVSLTIGPIALISTIPLVLPLKAVGTGLGLYKCAINIGATIMDPLAGLVQDIYGSYTEVMAAFFVFGVVTVAFTILFWVMDYTTFHKLLSANESERKAIEASRSENLQQMFESALGRPIPRSSYIAVTFFLLSLVTSWAMYIALVVYSSRPPPPPVTVLYMGGDFTLVDGTAANSTSKWSGGKWSSLSSGLNGPIAALAASDAVLYAGGAFTASGTTPAYSVASWNGKSWAGVGAGFTGEVNALVALDGALYAGGSMVDRVSNESVYAATWSNSAWRRLGDALDGPVQAMVLHSGAVYAGGQFANAGGVLVNGIARWSGSTAWQALGSGVSNGDVYALCSRPTGLFVGGTFTSASGQASNRIARWDGVAWTSLGAGVDGPVYALTAFNDNVCAGGDFSAAGGAPANAIACWSGSAWLPMAAGLNGVVRALVVHAGVLMAGGNFNAQGNAAVANLASWNSTAWISVGATNGAVESLVSTTEIFPPSTC